MKNVKVIGIGVICAMGNSAQDVWVRLNGEQSSSVEVSKLNYTSILPATKRRRINRYSDMALFSASNAMKDASGAVEEVDPARIGTIYSTGYGPMTSNLEFARKVSDGDPDLCSPTVFSSTVSNACVGHVCMNLNCKGVSTIIMGSNNLGYSQMLLSKNAADYILSGAVEEYEEDLYRCFRDSQKAAGIKFCESVVTLLLARDGVPVENSYCTLADFEECDLGAYPVFNQLDEKQATINMKSAIAQLIKDKKIDLIISSGYGNEFDSLEYEVIDALLPEVPCIKNVKELFGETLGVAFSINAMVACLILQKNQIPSAFHDSVINCQNIRRILVTGYNVSGGYIAYLFEK